MHLWKHFGQLISFRVVLAEWWSNSRIQVSRVPQNSEGVAVTTGSNSFSLSRASCRIVGPTSKYWNERDLMKLGDQRSIDAAEFVKPHSWTFAGQLINTGGLVRTSAYCTYCGDVIFCMLHAADVGFHIPASCFTMILQCTVYCMYVEFLSREGVSHI
jgi:hypothetical protein